MFFFCNGIQSPLVETGFTKQDVRNAANIVGLSIYDKPSNSCLASRIPWGQRVTSEKLARIEMGERIVKQYFDTKQVRVRDLNGIAKIEVDPPKVESFCQGDTINQISKKLEMIGFNSVIKDSTEDIVDLLEVADIDSNYTATYWPWIQSRDQENNINVWLPPTYEVVRNIALTDNVSFPWFASAGYTRGLTNALQARCKLTEDQRDTLYEGRINPMATFSDQGVVIWGNKNLQIADSALDRLNIRRLLLQTRKLISAVAVRLLFEQNDQIVRNQFLTLVNPILENIKRERGLADFRVQLSSDPEEIDRNELRGKIFLKPVPSLEFIILEFNVTSTGASFDDI